MLLTTIEEMHLLSKKIFFNSLSLHASKLLDKVCLKNSLHTFSSAKYVGLQKADFRAAFLILNQQQILCFGNPDLCFAGKWSLNSFILHYIPPFLVSISMLVSHKSYLSCSPIHFYTVVTAFTEVATIAKAAWDGLFEGMTEPDWLTLATWLPFSPLFFFFQGRWEWKDCCLYIKSCNFFSPIWSLLDFMFA